MSADHAHRGEALARHGVDRLLSSLHPRVRWVAPELQVLDMNDSELYLDGRGIELQPSAFCRQVPTKPGSWLLSGYGSGNTRQVASRMTA